MPPLSCYCQTTHGCRKLNLSTTSFLSFILDFHCRVGHLSKMPDPKLRGPATARPPNGSIVGMKAERTPKRRDLEHIISNGAPVTPATFTNGLSSNLLPKSSFEYPVLINSRDLGFPPTPPSNSREDQTIVPSDEQIQKKPSSKAALSRTSTVSAPLSQRSPPTPDGTPPTSLNGPWRSKASLISSSQAESFKTAREEQWSSDEEDDDDSIVEDAVGLQRSRTAQAVQPAESSIPSTGLGLAGFETEDEDITPTQSRVRISKGLKEIVPDNVPNPIDYIPNREWDTNMMRNVKVRRKIPQPPRPVNTDVAPIINGNTSSRSPHGSDPKHSPHTPSTATSSKDLTWSPIRPTARSHLRNSVDLKRISTTSTTSNIVEAVIIATPPPKPRTLRHVKKKVIVRSDSSSSSDSSPTSSTNALSLPSSATSQRTLPQRHVSAVVTPIHKSSPTPAVPLKHHRESMSLRSDAASSAERPRNLGPSPLSDVVVSKTFENDITPKRSAGKQRARPRVGSNQDLTHITPPRVKFTDSTNALADQKELNESPTSLTRSATQRALKASVPMAMTEMKIPQSKTVDTLPATEPKQKDIEQTSPSRIVVRRISTDKEYSAASSLSPSKPFSITSESRRHNRSMSLDEPMIEDTRRYSFDRSTIGTFDNFRSSLDRSNPHRDEHANARHLYSQLTPFSQISDALEVSEATAVNIYPHNNHSLLLVEHGAATESTQSPPSIPLATPPQLTVHPSTPPTALAPTTAVDSPLRNPRPPPAPPRIAIQPATPQREPPTNPLDAAAPPQRRPSLAARARRYSDSLLAPLAARTRSLRRSVRGRAPPPPAIALDARHAPSDGADADGAAEPRDDAAGRLHPFWHPRGATADDDGEDEDDEVLDEEWAGEGFAADRARARERRAGGDVLGRSAAGRVRKKDSAGSLGAVRAREGTRRRVWRAVGLRVEYVGLGGLREILRERSAARRRERLKSSIGERWPLEGEAAPA